MDLRHNAKVLSFLEKRGVDGATITEIIKSTNLTRDNVRISLAALEGAEKIVPRTVGKAKLFRANSLLKKEVNR